MAVAAACSVRPRGLRRTGIILIRRQGDEEGKGDEEEVWSTSAVTDIDLSQSSGEPPAAFSQQFVSGRLWARRAGRLCLSGCSGSD